MGQPGDPVVVDGRVRLDARVITSAGLVLVLTATFGALAVLPLVLLSELAFLVGSGCCWTRSSSARSSCRPRCT